MFLGEPIEPKYKFMYWSEPEEGCKDEELCGEDDRAISTDPTKEGKAKR